MKRFVNYTPNFEKIHPVLTKVPINRSKLEGLGGAVQTNCEYQSQAVYLFEPLKTAKVCFEKVHSKFYKVKDCPPSKEGDIEMQFTVEAPNLQVDVNAIKQVHFDAIEEYAAESPDAELIERTWFKTTTDQNRVLACLKRSRCYNEKYRSLLETVCGKRWSPTLLDEILSRFPDIKVDTQYYPVCKDMVEVENIIELNILDGLVHSVYIN